MGHPPEDDACWRGRPLLRRLAAFATAFLALLVLSRAVTHFPETFVPYWWPAGGFALGMLLVAPRRTWPAILAAILVGLALAEVFTPLARGGSLRLPLLWSLTYFLSPTAGAAFVRRKTGLPLRLRRPADLALLAVAVAISGAVGIAVLSIGYLVTQQPGSPVEPAAAWIGAVLGGAVATPLALTAADPPQGEGRRGEAALLAALLVLSSWAAFDVPFVDLHLAEVVAMKTGRLALPSALFLLLAWAGLRFGPRGAAWAAFVLTGLGTWFTGLGYGPFGLEDVHTLVERAAFAETFFGLAGFGSLLTATLAMESRERRERSSALHARLETFFHTAPVGIAVIDGQFRFLRANATLASFDGMEDRAHEGRKPSELLGDLGDELERALEETRRTGRPLEAHAVPLVVPDGSRRWLACTVFPLPAQNHARFGLFVRDETERVEGEAVRAEALAETRRALDVRDAFLSVASHELRTPLTPLTARLQRMRRQAEGRETIPTRSIDRALESVARLRQLSEQLVDASRLRDGAAPSATALLDWRPLVAESVRRYRGREGPHTFDLRLPARRVSVSADPAQLQRVVDALIDNAVKFSPRGGRIEIHLVVEASRARFSVRDEGIGIPPEDQARIFDRFARASNASSWSFGGLGLSLYTARQSLEPIGGRIWLESGPGRGSTFHVELPLAQEGQA